MRIARPEEHERIIRLRPQLSASTNLSCEHGDCVCDSSGGEGLEYWKLSSMGLSRIRRRLPMTIWGSHENAEIRGILQAYLGRSKHYTVKLDSSRHS